MTYPHDVQSVKLLSEFYQPLINGEKTFELRKDDGEHVYKEGEKLLLREIAGKYSYPECLLYQNCREIKYVKEECFVDDEEEAEDEARDICGEDRIGCKEYTVMDYTGRWCLVQIKKVFRLDKIGLMGYVAFTFDILEIGKDDE